MRWALNYAIDRDQIVNLAFEGSSSKAVVPLSVYGGVQKYAAKMQDIFDKYKADGRDVKKSADLLTKNGFKKDAGGLWQKPDGSKWTLNIQSIQGDPIAPVLVQQFRDAGFDAKFETLQSGPIGDAGLAGTYDLQIYYHCGSFYDPWTTYSTFNSKYATPIGTATGWSRAVTALLQPKEMDPLLNKMEQMQPSPDDPAYMDLVRKATDIILRDMPQVTLVQSISSCP